MNKVIVIGCSGSGKSTFSRKLHNATGIPLYHLDNIWWKEDRTHISRDEFDGKLADLSKLDRWIIDGNYSRTYEHRIAACDTVIFLDYGEEVCMKGIIGRVGQKRSDIPWVENELDPELVKLVKEYESKDKPVLKELFEKYSDKTLITFHTREEAELWIIRNFVIGLTVKGMVDRPLGTSHPNYPDMIYPINYGSVDGIFAEDGEEQDVYIFGTDKPLDSFEGRVIAVYHRTDDNEDKWIVSLNESDYSDTEILERTEFQEKYFKGGLVRNEKI